MAALNSDEVGRLLVSKLGCKEQKDKDHIRYVLYDTDGKTLLSRTKISHGPKHTIGDTLIRKMTLQIKLGTSSNFVQMVQCSKSKEECLNIIKASA